MSWIKLFNIMGVEIIHIKMDVAINELILLPRTLHYAIPRDKSKWWLLTKNLKYYEIKRFGGKLK